MFFSHQHTNTPAPPRSWKETVAGGVLAAGAAYGLAKYVVPRILAWSSGGDETSQRLEDLQASIANMQIAYAFHIANPRCTRSPTHHKHVHTRTNSARATATAGYQGLLFPYSPRTRWVCKVSPPVCASLRLSDRLDALESQVKTITDQGAVSVASQRVGCAVIVLVNALSSPVLAASMKRMSISLGSLPRTPVRTSTYRGSIHYIHTQALLRTPSKPLPTYFQNAHICILHIRIRAIVHPIP